MATDLKSGVTQTILAGQIPGRQGNCLQAAIATILSLPLNEVPHFAEADDWVGEVTAFADRHGYATVWTGNDRHPPALGLAFGPTIRSADVTHAVALRGDQLWDPHPSRAGLTSVSTYVAFEPVSSSGSLGGGDTNE